jgi:hypothetical protein
VVPLGESAILNDACARLDSSVEFRVQRKITSSPHLIRPRRCRRRSGQRGALPMMPGTAACIEVIA